MPMTTPITVSTKPKLDEIYRLGCRRFQDATPNFLGRDTKLLRKLADATGLDIWTNTGLYAARDHKFLPAYAKSESAAQLAARWAAEFRNGVDGMKPGFIKIGVELAECSLPTSGISGGIFGRPIIARPFYLFVVGIAAVIQNIPLGTT